MGLHVHMNARHYMGSFAHVGDLELNNVLTHGGSPQVGGICVDSFLLFSPFDDFCRNQMVGLIVGRSGRLESVPTSPCWRMGR
jgi:hypothetical protein